MSSGSHRLRSWGLLGGRRESAARRPVGHVRKHHPRTSAAVTSGCPQPSATGFLSSPERRQPSIVAQGAGGRAAEVGPASRAGRRGDNRPRAARPLLLRSLVTSCAPRLSDGSALAARPDAARHGADFRGPVPGQFGRRNLPRNRSAKIVPTVPRMPDARAVFWAGSYVGPMTGRHTRTPSASSTLPPASRT
jgi:hypothetical protein